MMKTGKIQNIIQKAMVSKILAATTALFILAACEINDPVGDISRPGNITANIYWDVPVTNVTAGNEVSFYVEYWSVDHKIDYLGVWYDIRRNMKYSLTYPGNGYTFTLDSTELSREFLEIKTFQHNASGFVAEKKAFVLDGAFPVSYTLSSLEYKNPLTFNAEQFNSLFPPGVRNRFLGNLFPQLTYQDFRTLLVVDRQIVPVETFEGYFDTITEGDVVTRRVKESAAATLRAHLQEVPFSAMVYNKNRQYFAVEFTRGYELNSRFRIVNGYGVENFSDVKRITVL